MAVVEGITTVEALNDVTSYQPLSPQDLIKMKSKVMPPLASKFQKEHLYPRKYWRRIQDLANQFWY